MDVEKRFEALLVKTQDIELIQAYTDLKVDITDNMTDIVSKMCQIHDRIKAEASLAFKAGIQSCDTNVRPEQRVDLETYLKKFD